MPKWLAAARATLIKFSTRVCLKFNRQEALKYKLYGQKSGNYAGQGIF